MGYSDPTHRAPLGHCVHGSSAWDLQQSRGPSQARDDGRRRLRFRLMVSRRRPAVLAPLRSYDSRVKIGVILPAAQVDEHGDTPDWRTVQSFA
jgi:hypothetical protein